MRGKETCVDDKRIALPAADRVAEPRAFAVNGMLAAIGIHDTLGVEPLVTNDDAVIEYFNLAQTMRRGQAGDQAVSAADRGRIVDGQMKQPADFRCWGVLMWSLGIGYSQHAGMVVVADGTEAAARRLERVLWNDPASEVMRHADAGYDAALDCAREHGLNLPMIAPGR